jgi:hypothetical protein
MNGKPGLQLFRSVGFVVFLLKEETAVEVRWPEVLVAGQRGGINIVDDPPE